MPTAPPPVRRVSIRLELWCALAVVVLAAAVRAPRLNDSLWYDEMTTLTSFVLRPWPAVLAPGAGQYVPNNHVLHTVLAKLVYTAAAGGRAPLDAGEDPREAMLRLPAWAAASLLPVALAWPLRRRSPGAAIVLAVVVAVHPWMVALGAEARGYTLMLLLGTVATNLLPAAPSRRRTVAYALSLAGAIYTVPLAVLLVPAHAVAVLATRRDGVRRWAVGAAAGLALAVALYLPMARGLAAYYRHPFPATMDVRQFLDALPRYALAGARVPVRPFDPFRPAGLPGPPDPAGSSVFWALPVLVLIIGSVLGWNRFPDARPLLATLATVTVLGAALPAVVAGAAEPRFVTWVGPWFCLAVTLLLAAVAAARPPVGGAAYGRGFAAAGAVVLLALFARWDGTMPPNQPVREAMRWANRHAPPGRPIVVAYIGANEVPDCYGGDVPDHALLPAPTGDLFRDCLAATRGRTGRLPWVVVLFEDLARDRNQHGLWTDLWGHYRPVARFDGRLTPVAVYAPRDETAAPAGPVTADARLRASAKEPRTEGTPAVSGPPPPPLTAGVPSVRGSFDLIGDVGDRRLH